MIICCSFTFLETCYYGELLVPEMTVVKFSIIIKFHI